MLKISLLFKKNTKFTGKQIEFFGLTNAKFSGY